MMDKTVKGVEKQVEKNKNIVTCTRDVNDGF
jgi:hypothetical protein